MGPGHDLMKSILA